MLGEVVYIIRTVYDATESVSFLQKRRNDHPFEQYALVLYYLSLKDKKMWRAGVHTPLIKECLVL